MFEEAHLYIEDRLTDNWAETPIDLDNQEFTPIRGISFVRLQILWAVTNPTSIGGRVLGSGFIDISIFTPSGTGSRRAFRMADDIGAIFNKWQYLALKTGVANIQRAGNEKEWYQVKAIVPFTYEECVKPQ